MADDQDVPAEDQAEFAAPENGRWFENEERLKFLGDQFALEDPIRVVDIGANPINGNPPYNALLQAGYAHVFGFEPGEEAFKELQDAKSENETYFKDAVGDGKTHTLHLYRHSGLTSLFPMNPVVRDGIVGFAHNGKQMATEEIQTRRLDDIDEISGIDFLKIDVQGAELMIFENAREKLKDTFLIQTEIAFVQLYKDQPTLLEVLPELKSQGFDILKFASLANFKHENSKRHQSRRRFGSQLIDGDIYMVRNLMNLDRYDSIQLKKFALLADSVTRSYDLVVRALDLLEARKDIESGFKDHYFGKLFHRLR